MERIVVGVSGASGIILAIKTINALSELGMGVELVVSKHALLAASYELGKEYSSLPKFMGALKGENIKPYSNTHVGASIASGSYQTRAMVIIPCSMATCAAMAVGMADNLLRRAADVTLKEKRPLIVVPRECPFSTIHLQNLLRLSELGATIVPPIPAWYTKPKSLDDIENFIVGRVLDALKLEHSLYPRWE